jgi:hypothetical protein
MKKKQKSTVKASVSAPTSSEITRERSGSAHKKNSKAKTVSNGKPALVAKANGKTNGQAQPLDYSEELDNRELLRVLSEVKEGNFTVRLPEDKIGLSGKICDMFNQIISLNEMLMDELTQAKNTIGKKGHLNHRVALPRQARGSWAAGVDSINTLISDLVHPTIEIAHVISSVAGNAIEDRRAFIAGGVCEDRRGSKRHGEAAEFILNGGNPRGKGGGIGRKTRWPGQSKRCCGCMERPD